MESAGSTQLSGGGAHPLPPLCRTPGSARKRLEMEDAASAGPSAGPARAEASSATRPGRAAERAGRERADRREAEREPAPRAALKPAREQREPRPAAPAVHAAKPGVAAPKPSRAAGVSFKNPVVGDGADALPPAPREPLGRRSVNEMFLGLWEPSLGGATPSVPRRAAIDAQPRLAGWSTQGVEEENEY